MSDVALLASFTLLFIAAATAAYGAASGSVRALPWVRQRQTPRAPLPSLLMRLALPAAERLSPLFSKLTWPRYRTAMARALGRAGIVDIVSVDQLLAMKAMTAVLLPLALSRLFAAVSNPGVLALVSAGGFFLPDRLVVDLRTAREHRIVRGLPGAVDVLSLSVEAGLDFLTALRRFVERSAAGPLRDELATVLNDIRIGQSRAGALKAFSQRVDIADVSSFVSVLVQGEMLGTSIGFVLRQQAEQMRVERFQQAEKAGARATQKILFPLVLFIFPAVLIVIMGPVALQFIYAP